MEHKLILGGEVYLPFARSQIKALRAAGINYASRRWVMPGGEIVTIRIEGEQEYIRLEGGSLQLSMDSGIVDLISVPLNVEHDLTGYSNGALGATISTEAYSSGYVPDAKRDGWLSKPDAVPHGQVIGTLKNPPFAGRIRADTSRAECFEAAREPISSVPGAPWGYTPRDDDLLTKKRMAKACPASMFTGRCRLYVQALYGRPLYSYGSDAQTAPSPSTIGRPQLSGGAQPTLTLPAYQHRGDPTTYPSIAISTSTGVRFDSDTGKHWLVIIEGSHLTLYPLISSQAGESMRKYLAGAEVAEGEVLSDGDREKLEAFVLAYSLPDTKNPISVLVGATGSGYSMGYSWHWNWSGTAADIVTSTQFQQPSIGAFSYWAMESTHSRITLSKSGDNWSGAVSTVEGPTQWAVNRVYWCIAEPDWANQLMLKTTPKYSTLFACDAPIYAFYARDELRVLRVAVTIVEATAGARTASPTFADGTPGGFVYYQTAGMLDGYCQDEFPTPEHYDGTFSCGSVSITDLKLGKSTEFAEYDLTKTGHTPGTLMPVGSTGASIEHDYGYSPPFGTPDHVSLSASPPSLLGSAVDSPPTITSTKRVSTRSRDESSVVTIVVPFFDAEAVYMQGATFVEEVESGITVTTHSTTALASALSVYRWVPSDGVSAAYWDYVDTYDTYIAGGPGSVLTTDNPPDEVTNTTVDTQYLVCRAGALTATMGELASYHDGEDYSSATFSAWSGAGAQPPVAFAPNRITATGVASVPTYPALVGWV